MFSRNKILIVRMYIITIFFIYTSITFVFIGKELDQQITNNQITKI